MCVLNRSFVGNVHHHHHHHFFQFKIIFFFGFSYCKKKLKCLWATKSRPLYKWCLFTFFFHLNKNWIHFNLISSWNHIFFLLTIDDRIWNRNIKNNNKWKILQEFYFLLFLLHSIFFLSSYIIDWNRFGNYPKRRWRAYQFWLYESVSMLVYRIWWTSSNYEP